MVRPSRYDAPAAAGGAAPRSRRDGDAARPGALAALALAALFLGVALWQAAPAFRGEFLADDQSYIVQNAYVHELSWENVAGLLDPWGEPVSYTANYAPVHLLLHAFEYAAFGPEQMAGWHAVNAVAHALVSLLLVVFFLRHGLGAPAAVAGGALFLTHPANAETVAWIFQLKTLVALGLAVGALLLFERRPGAATVLFALALLTKITALFALPVLAVQAWVRAGEGARPRWGWLGAWTGVALVTSVLALQAYGVQEGSAAHEDPLVHARTMVAIAMRYLVMAYTSWGLSAFHDPTPATSWLDPWWLAGLGALGLLGWRLAVTLWRREQEAVFWVFAAASYAPVSQLIPFIYPMGDRYLYPILPGLIGGTFLALRGPAARLAASRGERSDLVRTVALAAAGVVAVVFALRSQGQAAVYRSERTMMLNAALNYPDGIQAHVFRGGRAAQEGDAEAAAESYAEAVDRGYSNLYALLSSPALASVRDAPPVRAVIHDLAGRTVARLERREDPSQMELVSLGRAHWVRGDLEPAIRAYERALAREGPLRPSIRRHLQQLRRERSASRD